MTDETFAELMKSAKQALAYERGEVSAHRVTRIAVPPPPRVGARRAGLRSNPARSRSCCAMTLSPNSPLPMVEATS